MTKPTSPADLRVWELELATGAVAVISAPTQHARLRATLTTAERAIVELIVTGASNRAIARSRGTSERTVANQIAAIFAKLGVVSRGELIALVRSE
jgi:DNA-binding CsgD family transcriptional regulator